MIDSHGARIVRLHCTLQYPPAVFPHTRTAMQAAVPSNWLSLLLTSKIYPYTHTYT